MTVQLDRVHHTIGRAAEYFSASELEKQTGQPRQAFAAMALKELIDNALDAAETAGGQPKITIAVNCFDGELRIGVADNGPGLSPDILARILNFETRTSDKLAYIAPTRGLQGNAMKTLIGLPVALRGDAPIRIESGGHRHAIRAEVDPLGRVLIHREQADAPAVAGATISLAIPVRGQAFNARRWARNFALLNPHADISVKTAGLDDAVSQGQSDGPLVVEARDFYQSLVAFPGSWRKWLPSDPTSPHWYDTAALQRLLYGLSEGMLLRDFVRQFAGLSATAKAKAVLDRTPHLKRLADVRSDVVAVAALLEAMQHAAAPVKPERLGLVGEGPLRARIAECFGLPEPDRFWFAKALGEELDGTPFALEVAVAQTDHPGGVIYGLNFSPAFGDPFAATPLAAGAVDAVGVAGFLHHAHVIPPQWATQEQVGLPPTVALVHVVSPRLATLDRGKSRVEAGYLLATELGRSLWKATKTLHADGERRQKNAAQQARRDQQRRAAVQKAEQEQNVALNAACAAVIPAAFAKASGDGALPVSAHTLFYAVRPLVQAYTTAILRPKYFEQTILPAYQREHGSLPGLYYEPRGTLYEPHSGKTVPLGTRDVESYHFPAWRFDKVLFVEKQGLAPTLQAARLLEKYDLAMIAGEGFATVAARTLLEKADKEHAYRIFVVHDADPAGYGIARTLREETTRMPGYTVEIIDLGLRFEDGLARGLDTEAFTRINSLDQAVEASLTPRERAAFIGTVAGKTKTGKPKYACERIELNAMTAPQFVQFIEDGLAAHHATAKVVPPDSVVQREAAGLATARLAVKARDAFQRRFDEDAFVDRVLEDEGARRLIDRGVASVTQQSIADGFSSLRTEKWEDVVHRHVGISLIPVEAQIDDAINAQLRQQRMRRVRRHPPQRSRPIVGPPGKRVHRRGSH